MATELERLDELLSKQETRVRAAFVDYIGLVQSDAVVGMVTDLLEAGDVAGARELLERYVATVGNVVPDIQLDVGRQAMTELQALAPALAISFDATHERAAALVRTQRLALIQALTDSQLEAVQQAVERGVGTGQGAAATARAFRDAIGLTANQEQAVWSFRQLLEAGDRQSLTRALRDRRFDSDIRASIRDNQPLGARTINMMVQRYRERALMLRSETISRTEALRAYSEAREESLEQMIEQTGMDEDRVLRVWNRVGDKRTRDWHESMQGQTAPVDGTFTDGHGNQLRYPGDPEAPAETIINCRCTLTFRIKPAT